VQRPFNRLGVAVYAGPLVADDGFPASQVGRDLRLILLKRRVVVDRARSGPALRPHISARRAVTCAPRVTGYDNCINHHINATRHIRINASGQPDPAFLARAYAVRRCPCDSKLATTAAGAAVTTIRHTGVETPADARPTAAPSSDRVISTTDA
jgi:hypothetical protein